MAFVVCINAVFTVGWTLLLFHVLPSGTSVTAASKVFIVGIPLIMVQNMLNAIAVVVACEYAVFVRQQRLRMEIQIDRAERDLKIVESVIERLRKEQGESH